MTLPTLMWAATLGATGCGSQALEEFILHFLSRVPGVGNIKSSFALKQVKYQTALPLPVDLGSVKAAPRPAAKSPARLAGRARYPKRNRAT